MVKLWSTTSQTTGSARRACNVRGPLHLRAVLWYASGLGNASLMVADEYGNLVRRAARAH